jgi:hypothetical protein
MAGTRTSRNGNGGTTQHAPSSRKSLVKRNAGNLMANINSHTNSNTSANNTGNALSGAKDVPLLNTSSGRMLPFVALGRVQDQTILATAGDESETTLTTFARLLEASK